jgi:tRNA modification GTPase
MSELDTIAAIATAPGEGGVAIIRVSGPRCFEIADAVFACAAPPPSLRAGGTFVHGHVREADGASIDEALLLIMRAPHSYTREDTVELQGHGGPVVARRILQRVLAAGARAAEPGEFTKRAFLNGRLDLTQAEAVLDLIRARSDRAAAAALEQLEGALSRRVNAIYDRLLGVASNVEAVLDFSDQEIPENVLDPVADELRAVLAALRELLATWTEGHLLRDGATVVIAGKPNVGKSTLLNALLGRNRAIVSSQPGTTRDTIEETVVIGGYPLVLVDTAGLRETACDIEQEGIRRTRHELASADLCIYVYDAATGPDAEDEAALTHLDPHKTIQVANKIDISTNTFSRCIYTSCITGEGLDKLRSELVRRLDAGVPHSTQHAVISERHRALLDAALTQSQTALERMDQSGTEQLDLTAAQLREALEALGAITGRVYHDQLLDAVFGRFCIGK